MIDLNNIDLTQNRKFERSHNDSQTFRNDDRGIRHLKRGEIRHADNPYTYTTYNSISVTDLSSWTIDATSTSATLYWDTDTILNNMTINMSTTNYSYIVNSYMCNYLTDYSTNVDYSIKGRIKQDPFFDYDSNHNDDIISKMKQENISSCGGLKKHYDSIIYRMTQNADKDHNRVSNWVFNDADNILNRLKGYNTIPEIQYDDSPSTSNDSKIRLAEKNLKKKAPFIKRVYVTNGGRSFDSKEFNFDMILAKEHFENAILMHSHT